MLGMCEQGASPAGAHARISRGRQVDLSLEGLGVRTALQVRKVRSRLCDSVTVPLLSLLHGDESMCVGVPIEGVHWGSVVLSCDGQTEECGASCCGQRQSVVLAGDCQSAVFSVAILRISLRC